MTDPDSNDKSSKLAIGWKYLTEFFSDIIDLKKGVDPLRVIEDTRNSLSITGANAWMLMCSIIIASIGLSQNSQAVIIGAMLISPLMAPILGIGLSIGINDMNTLRQSLIHFAIAMAIAIITSSIYFYLSPIHEITQEIEARTQPTFLDIFVAIFGGTAGIISVARKDLSTTLPGVAIATALMPPLCVTGFGIAQGFWEIAMRSFYLFFLNTFFVVLATYVIIRYLKFPYKKYLDKRVWRKNVIYMVLFSLAIVVPSFLIFRGVMRDLNERLSCDKFVENCLGSNSIYLDSYVFEKNNRTLYLKVYGDVINTSDMALYKSCLGDVGLNDVGIEIIPTSDVNLNRVQVIEKDIQSLAKQLEAAESVKIESEQKVIDLNKNQVDTSLFATVRRECAVLFPDLDEIGMAKMHMSNFDVDKLYEPVVFVRWKNIKISSKREQTERLRPYLAQKMAVDSIRLIEQ